MKTPLPRSRERAAELMAENDAILSTPPSAETTTRIVRLVADVGQRLADGDGTIDDVQALICLMGGLLLGSGKPKAAGELIQFGMDLAPRALVEVPPPGGRLDS